MQLWHYCLLVNARSLYMFRTFSAFIIRSTETVVAATGACHACYAPLAATTVFSTPDDGRRKRPKYVE